MPEAPQLEYGRAGTHFQVCGTLPAASGSASTQPCVALGRFCFSHSPSPYPQRGRCGQRLIGVKDGAQRMEVAGSKRRPGS